MKNKKDIMVYYEDWRKLDDLKKDKGLKSMAELIKWMLTIVK